SNICARVSVRVVPWSETFRTIGTRPAATDTASSAISRQRASGIRSKRAVVPRIHSPWTPALIWNSMNRVRDLVSIDSSALSGVARGGTIPCKCGRSIEADSREEGSRARYRSRASNAVGCHEDARLQEVGNPVYRFEQKETKETKEFCETSLGRRGTG